MNEGGQIIYTATLTNAAQPTVITLSNDPTITIEAGKTTGTVNCRRRPTTFTTTQTVSTTITGATGGNFENLVPNTDASSDHHH